MAWSERLGVLGYWVATDRSQDSKLIEGDLQHHPSKAALVTDLNCSLFK